MKKFKEIMKKLGFSEINRNNYFSGSQDVLYVASVKKDKFGSVNISLSVTCARYFEESQGLNFYKSNRSPVWGWIGELGVGSGSVIIDFNSEGFSWEDVENTIKKFFGQFYSSSDLNAVSRNGVIDQAHGFEGLFETHPSFPIVGGALSRDNAENKVEDFLLKMVANEGEVKSLNKGIYAVQRKDNSDFFDCFNVNYDQFCTFVSFQFFPWSRKFWLADKSLSGEFYPFLRFWLSDNQRGLRKFTVNELLSLSKEDILTVIDSGFLMSRSVLNEAEYISALAKDRHFGSVASKLINWKSPA